MKYLPLFLLLFFPLPLLAQEGGLRLTVSPLPISLKTEPGKTITTDLKVKNAGTEEEHLKISVMKFSSLEGKPVLQDRTPQDDFLNWVSFSEPSFTLTPNEWKTITATFTLPETASFGYYYAFVFQRQNDIAPRERETTIQGGTAILVLLEAVVPNAKRAVKIISFETDKKFYEFLPTTFSVTLENHGNVHLAPRGNIFIDRGRERDIAILEINPERGNILPQSERSFEALWSDGFPRYTEKTKDGEVILDAEGRPEQELLFDWEDASKLRFGKYTAKLLLIYDDGKRDIPLEGEVSFWVVPWRLILLVILNFALIIGLALYVIRLRRRLKAMQSS